MEKENGEIETLSTGLVMPYSPEFDMLKNENEGLINNLVREGGGVIIKKPEEVFNRELIPIRSLFDISTPLLLLVLILLLIDIAIRRLNIKYTWVRKLISLFLDMSKKYRVYQPSISGNITTSKNKKTEESLETIKNNDTIKVERKKEAKNKEIENKKGDNTEHISQLLEMKRKWKK